MNQLKQIKKKFELIAPHLNERERRLWAAAEAIAIGRRGVRIVVNATQISNTTVRKGIAELKTDNHEMTTSRRIRKPGGGRKPITETYPKEFLNNKNPVISVDTKKKELIGNFKNAGREYAPQGAAQEVNVYDFQDKLLKAIPYGIYDVVKNEGWVNVGINNDTSQFAVESMRRWWNGLGRARYPKAKKLMITADGGGSNGSRVRLFKKELQKFSNETGLEISVCHFPPGTSKWNKIEHRMFLFISQNWRAKPLIDLVAVVNLIAATTTKNGLKICCELDENVYEKGIKVSNEEMKNLNIIRSDFHGEWNYTISPQ